MGAGRDGEGSEAPAPSPPGIRKSRLKKEGNKSITNNKN
jgi:hypothetical protein